LLSNGLHLGGGLDCDAGLESGYASHKERPATCGRIQSEDGPRFRVAIQMEAVRYDSDDRKGSAVHRDLLTHDGVARTIAAPPEALADRNGLSATRFVVVRRERAAEQRPDPQCLKEGCRDTPPRDLFSFTVTHDREALVGNPVQRLEGAGSRFPVKEVCDACRTVFHALLLERVEDHHQAVGLGEGQWAQQDPVEHAEDRGIGANAERQRQQRRQRERRIARQRASRVARVPDQVIE
jgi:hypothetical protein